MTNISKHLLDAEICMRITKWPKSIILNFNGIECIWDHEGSSREEAEEKAIHTCVYTTHPYATYAIISISSSAAITGETNAT